MTYRSRERVHKILAHQKADRVPYCAIRDAQVRQLIETMDLPADHPTLCLEGDFAFVTIEPEPEIEPR